MKLPFKAGLLAAVAFYSITVSATPIQEVREPEAATGITEKQAVVTQSYMVASANPYASKAGNNILAQGGSAIDAAIAIQLVLTLVEPQSSGIGGGAFILHWDKNSALLETYDGRETAPEKATNDLFLDKNGKPVSWINAVVGGRSVGVPGVLAAMKKAHQQHGKLPWESLFVEAIDLAENGFIVSPRLEKLVARQFNPGLIKLSQASRYFYPDGQGLKAGTLVKNSKLANVFKSLAKEGIDVFYKGWIAKKIVEAVQNAEIAPGRLTENDLANYQPLKRQPVCSSYRIYNVCGMAPPSSGGIAVLQTLNLLEPFQLNKREFDNAQTLHLFTQASRLAFADRAKYLADSDFVEVPVSQLLNKDYIASRSLLIKAEQDMGQAIAGELFEPIAYALDDSYELPSTSHISIVDQQGNAVSMTSSVEMAFGSAVMVEGFLLNNQLTDFSLSPKKNGQWVANRVEPFKRPRSSMAPMMIFNQDGSLKLVVGSPGGSRIINYVTQTILGVLDWQLNPQEAINLPKITNRNDMTSIEKNTSIAKHAKTLSAMGHKVSVRDLNSGIQAIEITKKGMIGGADPRREGLVLGK